MLFLAGLMGLMAVGSVAFVEVYGNEDEDEDTPSPTEALTSETLVDQEGNPVHIDPGVSGDIIAGSSGDDTLNGTDGDDEIGGYAGDDLLDGGAGNDDQHGDDGDDSLVGGTGDDSMHGDGGEDELSGGNGDDALFGHEDDDILSGGDGNDQLNGSGGDDLLLGEAGDDALQGSLGDDTLDGGPGQDSLFGGFGNDLINGVEAAPAGDQNALADNADFLNGGGGNDVIVAGEDDIVTSGSGEDLVVLGDWIEDGHAAEVMDYHPQEDSLLFVWDDTNPSDEAPDISVSADPENAEQTQIYMGEAMVALVNGRGLSAADLSLIPLSSAIAIGLADA